MTQLNIWRCDICRKEFRPGDAGYEANVGFEIKIPHGTQFEGGTKVYTFQDTCLNCRVNLELAIDSLIK